MYLLTTRKFNYTRVDFYVDNENSSDFWVTGEHLAELLGCYNAPERSIKRLHFLYSERIPNCFKEVEINARYKGICKTIVYNFDGLIKLCSLSGKKNAAEVVNFFWEMKQEFSVVPEKKNELQLFSYGGSQVRTIEKDGEFWFVAKDVCDILELTNPTEAIKSLDDDEKMTLRTSEGQTKRGGARVYNVINEPGVYRLIFRSNKPEAERFKHWIFHEVLPTLRKTGTYTIKKKLTGKATDTRFYSADELAAELKISENQLIAIVNDNGFDTYGFCNDADWQWYFTEEGREKILDAVRI